MGNILVHSKSAEHKLSRVQEWQCRSKDSPASCQEESNGGAKLLEAALNHSDKKEWASSAQAR
jgi:hypothetical protein